MRRRETQGLARMLYFCDKCGLQLVAECYTYPGYPHLCLGCFTRVVSAAPDSAPHGAGASTPCDHPPGGAGPLTMGRLQDLHARKFAVLRRFDREVREQFKIACGAGCGGCCNQAVLVQPYEAAHLAATLSRDLLVNLISQGYRQAAVFGGEFGSNEKAGEWQQRNEPCALLKGGKCAAYAVRPAACALVLTEGPAARCGSKRVEAIDAGPEIRDCAALERGWTGTPRWEIMGVAVAAALGTMDMLTAIPAVEELR